MYIKGFDKDLRCREMQFEVGKVYSTGANDADIKLCTNTVFHFCDSLEKVHDYYSVIPKENNRFCEIEVLGAFVYDDKKCGSNHIRIVREILGDELSLMRGLTNGNTGIFNSGSFNSGSSNSGSWNSGNNNNGFFCTNSPKIRLFNKETDFIMEEFMKTEWYEVLTSGEFNLTKWRDYTDEEKAQDERKRLIGGELITIPYKEACANWWASLSDKDKAIIKTIPNFDANIFAKITGIDVTNDLKGGEEE